MPYYYRRRKWYNRRWFRPRRFRRTVRYRRRWRRQPYRVRRKLKRLKIQQFQPKAIRKCCIKGIQPLFLANKKRLGNNYRLYEHSIIPEHGPGGGGFSVTKYSLDALFEQHELDRNWWTNTNQNLPLCRYLRCSLKFYQSANTDYVVNIRTSLPMLATGILYMSCQPSMMMMNQHCIIVPGKKTKTLRKQYKKITLQPPPQLENKWYFTKDMSKTGLVMITAAACSLDNYYINTQWESNNISFTSLNTHFWQMHNFQQPGVDGYSVQIQAETQKHLWATHKVNTTHNVTQLKWTDLIFLGNTTKMQTGQQITGTSIREYLNDHKKWGNPFKEEYLSGTDDLLISTQPLSNLIENETPQNNLKVEKFQYISQELLVNCRYTPDRDTGHDTEVYILSTIRDTKGWEPPSKPELIAQGFPLWLILFGFLDWQRKLAEATNLDRDWVLVIRSPFITPQLPYYVILDYDFLHGQSPYPPPDESKHISDTDLNKWYPCTYYQHQTVENIIHTGPGIAKLGTRNMVEAKLFYKFYFKWGGDPPKMDTISDPTELPIYPISGNEPSIYSLQNPNIAPETLLYQFDIRKDTLTKKAAKRIKQDWEFEKTLFTDANKLDPEPAIEPWTPQTSEEDSDSEKEEATLLKQLQNQRRKRKKLQLRLLKLMQQT